LQNGIKYHIKFLTKSDYFLFILILRGKKTQKKPQVLIWAINSIFWMELNMTLKILVFYILSLESTLSIPNYKSFQESWRVKIIEKNTKISNVK